MTCRLVYAASVVSLLLCTAAVVLWVKTDAPEVYAVSREWLAPEQLQSGSWNATAVLGDLTIWRLRSQWADRQQYDRGHRLRGGAGWRFEGANFTFNPNPNPPFWERFGFTFHSQTNDFGALRQTVSGLTLPLWSVVVATAIPAVLAAVGVFRRRRARARHAGGLCSSCGYDLRASTDRCPECGAPIPAEANI